MPFISLRIPCYSLLFFLGSARRMKNSHWISNLVNRKKNLFHTYCDEFDEFDVLNQFRDWLGHADFACWSKQKFDSCWKKLNSYALMPSRICTVVNKRLEDWNLRIQRLQRCASLICVWNAVDWGLFFLCTMLIQHTASQYTVPQCVNMSRND